MPAEVTVTTDPLIVYGLVGLLLGAVVLALIFARPRRGFGAVKRSDLPDHLPTDEPWMPTGDIFGHDREPSAAHAVDEMPASPVAPPPTPPPASPPPGGGQPTVHDPWSTGASGQAGAQPRWGKR